MKLEPNMYVRTKNGLIAKYIGYEKNEDDINFSKYNFDGKIYWYYEYYNDYVYEENFKEWFEKRVVKTSHNIIDLIEVGDYVNGYKVIDIVENDIYISDYYAESYIGIVKAKDIKIIVTKEMFANAEYRVETN